MTNKIKMKKTLQVSTASQQDLDAEAARMERERVDERNFLILRVVVRSAVAITLVTLASMFAALFLHNWRQWELNIREKVEGLAELVVLVIVMVVLVLVLLVLLVMVVVMKDPKGRRDCQPRQRGR